MNDEIKSRATDSTGQWAVSRAANARKVALRRLSEMHPRQFAALLEEERVARNLTPKAIPKPRAAQMKEVLPVGGTVNRSVTVTLRYGDQLRTLVERTQKAALAEAQVRWGQWDCVESVSTPNSIYNDITGQSDQNLSQRTAGR